MSRRNGLLPNIAHTMCGVYRRTRSRSIKYKLERLLERSHNGNVAHESTGSDDPQSNKALLPAAIQARLWCLMQQKLLNPQAWPKRNFHILSGPQPIRESELGSHMLDDVLLDQSSGTGSNDEDIDLLLEGQYTSGEVESGVGGHPFDEPEGTGTQYPDSNPSTNRNLSIDDDRAGKDLLWPDQKSVLADRSAEEGLSYGRSDIVEAGDDMDEDLFRSETDVQGPHQDVRKDKLGEISRAKQNHDSQASSEGLAQCESTKLWDPHGEEILDNEQDIPKDHRIYPEEFSQLEMCQVDLEEILDESNNVLDNGLAHCLAQEEDYQELLDARRDIRNTDQDSLGHMDHEMLDDAEITLQSSQVLSEGFPPYTPWKQGHQELLNETEIISDPQTADAGFPKDFFVYDGDEMLDGERMIFDADQGNQALIMV